MTSSYAAFILFHPRFVHFELQSFNYIQIEESMSWSLFNLILPQQMVAWNHLLQLSQPVFIDHKWKVLSAPPGFVTSLLHHPPPRLLAHCPLPSLGRYILHFSSCGNSSYSFFNVHFTRLSSKSSPCFSERSLKVRESYIKKLNSYKHLLMWY